jgi:hypothetical protein
MMRKSTAFLFFITVGVILFAALIMHGSQNKFKSEATLIANAELVGRLKLTDLSLFTEARYTRHPSMADLHSAFQDHPLALDHFPSGSLVSLPRFRNEAP